MLIDKDDVIQMFCELSTEVMHKKFNCNIPADCFCEWGNEENRNFQFDERITDFIKEAVKEKLER